MMKESGILKLIMLRLSELGCVVWRNNTGAIKVDGRYISYGLHKGSSDIIGIAPGGKFLAIETKTRNGRISPEQVAFINAVNKAGGIAGVCRSVEDAEKLVRGGHGV